MPSGGIVFIEGEDGARFPDANSLFIDDEIPAVIDPATRPGEMKRLASEMGVRLVIDTHYHVDHTRYSHLFGDAEVLAHKLDAPAIESLDHNARLVGIDAMPWVESWKKAMREMYGLHEVPVSRTVEDGEELCIGENTLRFLHTPGHTPGHLCIEFVERRSVYLADIDLTPFGPWYGNLASDIDSFLESIERVKRLRADTWYTAHEMGTVMGDVRGRLDEFAAVVAERDDRLLDFLGEYRKIEEIVDRTFIYGKRWKPPEMFEFFEGMMVRKHLERMERRGLAEHTAKGWRRL